MATNTRTPMSDEHKSALAQGRDQGRAVRRYLDALESSRPRRGRRRSPEAVARRLAVIDDEIAAADPLRRLHLVQERLDLRAELEASRSGEDLARLEDAFVAAAATYGERKGITYSAWRQMGVPGPVLARAGIHRSG